MTDKKQRAELLAKIGNRKEIPRGDISLLTQPMTGATRYQWVAWKAGYKSAAEFSWHNRRGGD